MIQYSALKAKRSKKAMQTVIKGEQPIFEGRMGYVIATKPRKENICSGCCLAHRGINCGTLCCEREYETNGVKCNFHKIKESDVVVDTDGNKLIAIYDTNRKLILVPHTREEG